MITFHPTDFLIFCNSILNGYSDNFKNRFDADRLANQLFSDKSAIQTVDIIEVLETTEDPEHRSVLQRVIAIIEIIEARDNGKTIDLKKVWNHIKQSIESVPLEHTISSIGSQGFLSIPLYKYDSNLHEFDFIRLHIWDKKLFKLMDMEKCKLFGIHTHTFFAKSWIITGTLLNERFDYTLDTNNPTHSIFKVIYNDSLNKVNQHSSRAINQHVDVEILKTVSEVYAAGSTYEIEAGKFHRSNFIDDGNTAATFFSFTGKHGLSKSIVLGPKDIEESEINRKEMVDPTELLLKISNQLYSHE